uniref:Uncharacterized protein n=1 Tax=Physcomitrium patens TaxID=3218 RepID=A0A2K1KQB5_PHYPA|nr:hypothetical protein PHYPA_006855 [Physcomitrium patens]
MKVNISLQRFVIVHQLHGFFSLVLDTKFLLLTSRDAGFACFFALCKIHGFVNSKINFVLLLTRQMGLL